MKKAKKYLFVVILSLIFYIVSENVSHAIDGNKDDIDIKSIVYNSDF